MNWDIHFAPWFPWWLIATLVALGMAIIAASALGRARGWMLRAVALALLGAALANPSIRNEEREALSDIAVVVVDRSQSQTIANRAEQTTAAEARLMEVIKRLGNTELKIVTARSGISAEEDGTRLFAALDSALADVPPERFAGAILLTDGEVHDVPADAAKTGINGPVHGLLTGSPDEKDRRIVIDTAPRFGIVGKPQTIRFHVEETGGTGEPVRVTTLLDDGTLNDLFVVPGEVTELLVIVAHGGQNITELTAAALPGEITDQNNRAISVIEGIRDRLRVLLVSGEPHPGERTWRNLLKSDPSVDLVHFTILRPPEKQDGTPIKELSLIAFPTRELFVEKLDEFDLVIFDRYNRQGVLPQLYLANVADYVERGGAVLLAAGPDFASPSGLYYTPLGGILSTVPTGEMLEGAFKPKVTAKGERHPVTRGLPGWSKDKPAWGRWFRLVDTDATGEDAVMSGLQDKPLLVLSRKGEGRVATLLSDHGWLWARGYDGGGPQTELLRRMAHWLMKEPDLEEEALTARQSKELLTVTRQTMGESVADIAITLPSGKVERRKLEEATPGQWQASITVSEAGLHKVSDGKLSTVAAVGSADPRESAELIATAAKLQPVADATGGGITWLAEARDGLPNIIKVSAGRQLAGSGWLGLKANNAYRVTAVTEIPLFASLLALAAMLMGLGAMWYREGR